MTNNTAETSAKIILHSITPEGKELISIEACAPYFLDAEIEKHGELSSNSSSNRAIPFNKMCDSDYFVPYDIRENQSGMQGFKKLDTPNVDIVTWTLANLREYVIQELLAVERKYNVHKQHLNRYLAPWSMQKKILTGTRQAWNGVMLLRNHPDADPAIQDWAKKIQYLLNTSIPTKLEDNEWHMPYISDEERSNPKIDTATLLKVSAARCARTSYRLHDGAPTTIEKDIPLFYMLAGANPMHLTPLTHQGLNCSNTLLDKTFTDWPKGVTHLRRDGNIGSGNFSGFIQFRHFYLQGLHDE